MTSSARSTFAQLVIGPPGSGKTTYCKKMSEFLQSIGRKVAVINIGKICLPFFWLLVSGRLVIYFIYLAIAGSSKLP